MKFKLLLRKLWCWPCQSDPYLLGCILLGQKHSYLGQVLGREVNLQTLRETLDVNNRRQPYFQRIPAALGATHRHAQQMQCGALQRPCKHCVTSICIQLL